MCEHQSRIIHHFYHFDRRLFRFHANFKFVQYILHCSHVMGANTRSASKARRGGARWSRLKQEWSRWSWCDSKLFLFLSDHWSDEKAYLYQHRLYYHTQIALGLACGNKASLLPTTGFAFNPLSCFALGIHSAQQPWKQLPCSASSVHKNPTIPTSIDNWYW